MPAAPPIACTTRQPVSASTEPARAQPSDAIMKSVRPTSSGGLRPKRSAIGP
ncbi:Uncharacterised protein [Achromobacter sp. 2789STDY5608615]|nr:Uncharacterised protein [Achromobacter sp. 2789STDY5608615]